MTDELARRTDAIFARGLDLKARLDAGEQPDLDAEQAVLRQLLGRVDPAAGVDFAGDTADPTAPSVGGPPFLGLRYALTCWLDELIILHTRWDAVWTERKLEESLYGTNDRAWRFWEQAAAADRRADPAVLSTFVLCVALGFRGDYQSDPAKLAEWLTAAKERAARPVGDPPIPAGRPTPADVPPLRGRHDLRRMVVATVGVLLLTLPLVAYLAVRRLSD